MIVFAIAGFSTSDAAAVPVEVIAQNYMIPVSDRRFGVPTQSKTITVQLSSTQTDFNKSGCKSSGKKCGGSERPTRPVTVWRAKSSLNWKIKLAGRYVWDWSLLYQTIIRAYSSSTPTTSS